MDQPLLDALIEALEFLEKPDTLTPTVAIYRLERLRELEAKVKPLLIKAHSAGLGLRSA